MEKTKRADLERNRGMFLQIGFFLALAIIWLVLEWTSSPQQPRNKTTVGIEMDVSSIVFYTNTKNQSQNAQNKKGKRNSSNTTKVVEMINPYLHQAEHMPRFQGGVSALKAYTENKLRYPPSAKQQGIEGKVLVSFHVDTAGWVQRARVVRSIHPTLDKEALRIVKTMPRWIPAAHHGKKPVEVVIPILFHH